MPTIELSRQHKLTEQQARGKVEEMGKRLAEKHGLNGGWASGDRYEFSRSGLKGRVQLEPGKVAVRVELSLLLSPLKGTIEQKLREGLEKEFA